MAKTCVKCGERPAATIGCWCYECAAEWKKQHPYVDMQLPVRQG